MDSSDLRRLALRTRSMRESSIALLIAAGVLALFLFVPLSPRGTAATPAVSISTSTPDAFAAIPLEAKAAIVLDLATGKVLYAKNADAQLPLASLTKLLTVYAAISELSPSRAITIPADAEGLGAPSAFAVGETFSLADLARLTMTGSLNDGATAIADATAEQEARSTPDALAAAASALGLSETYAINGSGLDESLVISGGYGSARDVATLAGALVALAPSVAAATTEPSATAVSSAGKSITVKNTDPMTGTFPHLLLSKTGNTDLAGGNLALVFDAGIEHPIAVVVLGSSENGRFTDGQALVAATFAHFAGLASLSP